MTECRCILASVACLTDVLLWSSIQRRPAGDRLLIARNSAVMYIRQKEHLDKLDSSAVRKPYQPFSSEITVLVGLYGRFRVTCYFFSSTAVKDDGHITRTSDAHATYDLGPGDMLVFDASYCFHYGDELTKPAIRLHFSYHMVESAPENRPALIDSERSKMKINNENIYF